MTEPAGQYQEMRDVWSDYIQRQEFEHDLINRKTMWLLTTQTIIFAAYGLTFDGEGAAQGVNQFRDALEWSGLLIALVVLFGVLFLIKSNATHGRHTGPSMRDRTRPTRPGHWTTSLFNGRHYR